jgi:hypothetical protein
MADNAFVWIADWLRAQTLADALSPKDLHRVLDSYAAQRCPVLDVIGQSYHWSLMQVEYSTDLVFRSQAMLAPLYEQLARQAVLNVKAEHVAAFLGHKITPQLAQEIGSRFATRIDGTCIKHVSASRRSRCTTSSRLSCVWRAPPTTSPPSSTTAKWNIARGRPPATCAPVKKTIYSLPDLREILLGCNRRYLTFLSALDDFSAGARALDRLTTPRVVAGKTVKGINFFNPIEQRLLRALQRPAFNIAGIRRAHLLPVLDKLSPATVPASSPACALSA